MRAAILVAIMVLLLAAAVYFVVEWLSRDPLTRYGARSAASLLPAVARPVPAALELPLPGRGFDCYERSNPAGDSNPRISPRARLMHRGRREP